MSISLTCQGCKAQFKLADDVAGDAFECPTCGQRIPIPRAAARKAAAPTAAPPATPPHPAAPVRPPASPAPAGPDLGLSTELGQRLHLKQSAQGAFLGTATALSGGVKTAAAGTATSGHARAGAAAPAGPAVASAPSANPMVSGLERRHGVEDRLKQRLEQRDKEDARGSWVTGVIALLLALLLVGGGMGTFQYLTAQNPDLMTALTLTTLGFAAVIGLVLFIASLMQGFLQFFLVTCLPSASMAAYFLVHPLLGMAGMAFSQLYVVYFVFVRMKAWFFKGLFLAFLVTMLGTGPYFLASTSTWYQEFVAQLNQSLSTLSPAPAPAPPAE